MLISYCKNLARLHAAAVSSAVESIQNRMPPSVSCKIQNFKQILKKRSVRFDYNAETRLFRALDSGREQYFSGMIRGFGLYAQGLKFRGDLLANSYLLGNIQFEPSDVVIDCGANYADLFIYFSDRVAPENYISFEPSGEEFRCVEQNAPAGKNFNKGLGDQIGSLTFFVSSEGADSSFVQPKTFTERVEVDVTTLDQVQSELGLKKVKLLKLEAEGFEPEILQGAPNLLQSIEYVAIDGGRERGVTEEETFSSLANTLFKAGFSIVEVNFQWGRALFRRNEAT